MGLPIPIPDNPTKWDGWRSYNSSNMYERLCIDASSNPTDEVIEANCRELLVWWKKKLPLKSQPSNPIAQLLRQGLDDAPRFITEARVCLLDPEQRAKVDAKLHEELVSKTMDDFRKLLAYTLGDQKITEDEEKRLYGAGYSMGLTDEDMKPVVEEEIIKTGTQRIKTEDLLPPPPPPSVAPTPVPVSAPAAAAEVRPGDPFEEFRKILRMSRLAIDDDEMTDDQRDAMCNLGESLGLTGGQAEDLIDEYLEAMAAGGSAAHAKPPVATAVKASPIPAVKTAAPGATKPVAQAPAPPPRVEHKKIVISPMVKAGERQKYPKFSNSIGMQMLLVTSGHFEMGSEEPDSQVNEQPITPVTLSCFYIGRHPVTNAQYELFDPAHSAKRAPWADDNHPVIYVTALEAEAFCKWLSQKDGKRYRLPTEPEWEYAARGEDGRTFPWGEGMRSGDMANFADARTQFPWKDASINDGFAETSPVGNYPRGASPFGIDDMAGNVFEWCQDWMFPYGGKELVNPKVTKTGTNRIFRGGSWRSRLSSLRAAARNSNLPTYQSADVGFRVVCECE